jgi:tetratricopeptide (TPR) repeat protein
LKERLGDVILVQIDAEKGEGIDLKEQYSIKGYPTFILANEKGEAISRWWGYSKEIFFEELDLGFSDLTTISEKEERYKNKPDAKTARILATYYNTRGEMQKAATLYEDAAKYDPDNDYAFELFQIYYSGLRRKVYTLDEVQVMAKKAVKSESIDPDAKTQIYAQMTYQMKANDTNEQMLAFLKEGYTHLQNHQETAPAIAKNNLNISYALLIEKDEKKAVKLKKASLPEGWENNASYINSFSWWCFENKINLKEADQLGRKAVKLAQPGREKAMILDTVAEIVNLIGFPEDSVGLMERAIKEDPDNEYYKKQLDRFRKLEKR